MKRVVITFLIMVLAVGFIVYHNLKVSKLDDRVSNMYDTIIESFDNDDFDTIVSELESLREEWEDTQTWIGMTIDTNELEEIDISLKQSIEYARIGAKEDFIGEFIMFNQCIKHLTYYERITPESLM